MPRIAPRSTKPATQFWPANCSASETGWSTPANFANGTMPVMMAATTTYSTVHTASEPMMPIGRSRRGLRTSSAAEVTASKPIKAKNTSAAALKMPAKPNGANGCQLAGCTCHTPTAINSSTTPILTATIRLLMRVDSRTPYDTTQVMASMIRHAGRFSMDFTPGTEPGAAVSAAGSFSPKPAISDWK
ncbi:hypothetical protein D3C72_1513670 [compost metagenome]